jgi:hypothetical protein
VFTLALLAGSCAPSVAAPTQVPAPSATVTAEPTASPTVPAGLADPILVRGVAMKHWQLVPDALNPSELVIDAEFASDPRDGLPTALLRGQGRVGAFAVTTRPNVFHGLIGLVGLAPGAYVVDVTEVVRGQTFVAASIPFVLSHPEYVVWTLDFEGDAASDDALANTGAIADERKIPMTIMWNPRVWTTGQVPTARADAMLAWTKARVAGGDELSLHLHMWTDFVRAAGLVPRTAPSWAGRSDGYDVPMTAYTEAEQRTLVEHALGLMARRGLARPTTFRAGGQFANDATLRALAALGFVADASAVPAGSFGRLAYPWTLAPDAQPYRPSATDANRAGDLPLLEAPTIGGNTYAYNEATIQPIIRADLSYLAPEGDAAPQRRAITIVSHPSTIDPTERRAIAALFDALAPLRYDLDKGPLRFVTLAQLAQAWR